MIVDLAAATHRGQEIAAPLVCGDAGSLHPLGSDEAATLNIAHGSEDWSVLVSSIPGSNGDQRPGVRPTVPAAVKPSSLMRRASPAAA